MLAFFVQFIIAAEQNEAAKLIVFAVEIYMKIFIFLAKCEPMILL